MSKFGPLGNSRNRAAEPAPPTVEPPSPAPPSKRPKGKKNDPAYQQVTAYVLKDQYKRVQGALFNRHGGKEFSVLVGELLAAWLDGQTSK